MRQRVLQVVAILLLLLMGADLGGMYAMISKDGRHPVGLLLGAIGFLALALLAAIQRPNRIEISMEAERTGSENTSS